MFNTESGATSAPTVSPDLTDLFAREAARNRLAAEIRPANKAALFDALAAAGITHVFVAFDGEGDSGQIESVTARAGHDEAQLPGTAVEIASPAWDGLGVTRRAEPVGEAIETLAYALLEETHGGWENNEGAYGEFTFDVAERTITLLHHERYTEVDTSEHTF